MIEFAIDLQVDLAGSPWHRLERAFVRRGTRLRPHVLEDSGGPVEVADLFFADGTAAYDVPFACFIFA
jgi:hypothetical protein